MASSALWTACSVENHFARRRLAGVAQALVLEPARLPDEQPAHLDAGGHLRDHLLDELVLADLLAERVALVGVADAASRHAWASPTAPAATV